MLKTLKDEKGVIAIATTPFDEKNQIDFNSVDTLADYYLENQWSIYSTTWSHSSSSIAAGSVLISARLPAYSASYVSSLADRWPTY